MVLSAHEKINFLFLLGTRFCECLRAIGHVRVGVGEAKGRLLLQMLQLFTTDSHGAMMSIDRRFV